MMCGLKKAPHLISKKALALGQNRQLITKPRACSNKTKTGHGESIVELEHFVNSSTFKEQRERFIRSSRIVIPIMQT